MQLGDLGALGATGWDGNSVINLNTLQGGVLDWLLPIVDEPRELIPYRYPSEEEIRSAGLQIIYSGWALGDWGLARNGEISCAHGLNVREGSPLAHGDPTFVTSLDEDWVAVNQFIKYLKYGFGRATDFANEEIRAGRMTRESAVDLVLEFDGRCSEVLIGTFCEYLEIPHEKFWDVIGQSANPDLFEQVSRKKYRPKFIVGTGL